MGIRAILFDADGVVQRPSSNLPALLNNVLGISPERADAFLHNVVSPAERHALTGKHDFSEELAAAFVKCGCAGTVPQALGVFTAIETYADMVDLVRWLRSSGTLSYLASNQAPYRARYMSEVLGYREIFDQEFYSCDLGYAKPNRDYFREVLRKIGLAPDEALFIDDHEENVAAAREVGLHASHFIAKNHDNRRGHLLNLFARYGLILS
jgi:putative hydrolase of the HAD superfamily